MVNELQAAFKEIAELRALPQEVIIEALQSALVSAYRRDSGASQAQQIEARIDPATGRARIFVEKEVADEIVTPLTEVTLEKARYYAPEAQIGDMVMVQVEGTTKKFGRIAAQTAKQVILQKIREAERNALYEEFSSREGDLTTATVQNVNSTAVTLGLGRTEAIMPKAQQIPGEHYHQHQKLRVYIMEVKRANRGPQIICSRGHRNMLRRLLEYEVPEIYNGQVEIKGIAREAGQRSKVAVAALQEGIDPVGACVGMRGIRIQNIVKELHDEKIDVIEWSLESEVFISKALSPARVVGVYLDEDLNGRTAIVVVRDDQLSLAIGREGQNARLAAKLTGWRIDIKAVSETVESALENLDVPPLSALVKTHAPMIEDVRRIVEKRVAGKAIMPEEYNTLDKFADLVETRLQRVREEMRAQERAQVEAVKSTLPQELFQVSLNALALPEDLLEALEPLGNVGEVMLAMLVNETRIKRLAGRDEAVAQVQAALDVLMEADIDFAELIDGEEVPQAEVEQVDQIEVAVVSAEEEPAAALDEPVVSEAVAEEEEEVLLDAFGGSIEPSTAVPSESAEAAEEFDLDTLEIDPYAFDQEDDDFDLLEKKTTSKKKKGRTKKRQLVFDENSGEVVAKRRRKGNRSRFGWDEEG